MTIGIIEGVSIAQLRSAVANRKKGPPAAKKGGGGGGAPSGPKMPKGPPGMIISPLGSVFKPEECGVDGNGNGWCSGEAVPAEWFMSPEELNPKPAKLKSAKKDKKDKKKKDDGGGRIMAVKVLSKKSKPKKPLNSVSKPKKMPEPSSEPIPAAKGKSDPWIVIVIIILALPLGYFLWKKYQAENGAADGKKDGDKGKEKLEEKSDEKSDEKAEKK